MKLDQIFTLECLEREVREPLTEAIRNEYGVTVSMPIPDGKIHRFSIDKRGDKVGWYVLYEDVDFSCAVYGNWKTGDQHKWISTNNLTTEQHYRLECHMADVEKAQKELQATVAKTAETIYEQADEPKANHPYLVRKKVGVDLYLKQFGEDLILPILNSDMEIVSVQYISPDGRKTFLKGGQTSGGFCPVGMPQDYEGPVFMAEGYATAMSVVEATKRPCIIAFNAGNLPKVADELRDLWDITVVADNDASGTGEKYAKATGLPYKLIPRVGMDANDYAVAGYDLKEFLIPSSEHNSWLLSAEDFVSSYKPSSWIIKGWLPSKGQTMIYGKAGCGKTFALIDMMLSISTGQSDWFGHKVKKGNVVYLAGEGHEGLRKRLKVWMQEKHLKDFGNFAIAQSALDLDSAQGLQDTADSIKALPFKPDVIAIDTLNRFFSGDENSAQEMRGFIESCSELQRLFECAIIIVHHTGVSETAQNRARGSSALKGAVDTEILVTKDENGLLTLTQTKQKDIDVMDDLTLALKGHIVQGWVDEDGDPLTSATLELPQKEDRKKAIEKEINIIKEAYRNSSREHDADDYPYVSRNDLKDYLMEGLGMSLSKAKNAMRDEPYRLIGKLIDCDIVKASENGWSISDLDTAQDLIFDELK